jgi:biotin operon repressor
MALLGFIQLPTLVLYDRRLNPSQKLLYSVLLRYAGRNDHCWPGVDTVARSLGLTKRSIQEQIVKLEEVGLITREVRHGKSSVYWIEGVDEVYASEKMLNDKSIQSLRDAGENRLVDTILKRREGEDPGEDSDDSVVSDMPVEDEGEKEEGVVELPHFEKMFAKKKELEGKSLGARNRRSERHKIMAQDPHRKVVKINNPKDREEYILTASDVEEEWRISVQEKWPGIVALAVPWTVANRSIAKNLIKLYDAENVIKLIWKVIKEWESYQERFALDGYPTMKLVAGFAETWFAELEGGEKPSRRRRTQVLSEGEYDGTAGTDGGGLSFLQE